MRETSVVCVSVFFYLLIVTHSHADFTIPGCGDGYIGIREDRVTIITCDVIGNWSFNIYWAISEKRIGDCNSTLPGDHCSLTDYNNTDYQLSRKIDTKSELRILGNLRSKAGENVTCSSKNNAIQVSCVINIIYEGGETSSEQAKSMTAIGGGVGAAVAVIVIIIVVALVIVYQRRQKTYERPKVRRNEDTHPYIDLSPSVTASTSDVSHPEYNETNIAMGQSSIQESEINTYDQLSPRRNEDTYLYTDLTPSVTSSAPGDASRDYRGNSIEAGQGSTEGYNIIGCSRDGYIDVREDTGTTITCDGIQGPTYNIYWALSGKRIGDCGDLGHLYSCWLTDTNNTDYNLTRPSASKSELSILRNFRSKAGQKLTCSTRKNDTQVSCVINIILAEAPQTTNTAAIGGGVGAVVAVVIVAIIVLIIVWRRRRNSTTRKTHDDAPADKGIMDPETEAGCSSLADDLENHRVSEGRKKTRNRQDNQHANNQIPSEPASKRSEHVQNTQGAMYANVSSIEAKDCKVGTSQEDVYAVVDKSKKAPQQTNDVTSPNTTDQTNDPSPRGTVQTHVLSSSEPRDTDIAWTLEDCDTKLHHDAKTDKRAAAADPTANVKLINRQTVMSEAPTGEEERIHNRKTRSTKQNYENVGPCLSHTPLQTQRDSAETTTGDEYNKLNLLNPQGQRQREPNPDYSHLGSL